MGTIDYIAPEQIRGEPATGACDIYALSAVLYECLTGTVPYPKPSDAAVMYAHLSEPPPLVTDQRPELPPNLDEVICKAMDKDPGARYATATGLIDEAERALGKRVRAVITPPGPIEGPEEAGIREKESRVPTRPERVRRNPDPVPDAPPAGAAPTTPGVTPALAPAAAAAATAAAATTGPTVAQPADPTRASPAVRPEESSLPMPADPTRASPAVRPEDSAPADATVASPAVRPEESKPADATIASPAVRPEESAAGGVPTVESAPAVPAAAGGVADGRVRARVPAPGARRRAVRRRRPLAASPRRRRSPCPPPSAAPPRAGARRAGRPRPPAVVLAAVPAGDQAPPRTERRTASSRFPWIAAAVAIVIGAVAGYLLGKPADDPAPPKADTGLSSSTTAGALGLRFPGSWERRGEAPKIPGLALKDQVAVGPASSQGQGVIAGMSAAQGARLLPPAFLSGLRSRRGRPTASSSASSRRCGTKGSRPTASAAVR